MSRRNMANGMDHSALRHMNPRELALHLRRVSEEQSVSRVSSHLLEAIEQEVLPPTVFDTFLTSVASQCPLRDALWQQHSKHIRYAAIRRFGKRLKGVDWEDAWQEVGGTEGLLDLFAQLSVLEVKELCKVIGRCSGQSAVKNGLERQCQVTELVQCLMSPFYPSSPYKSMDQRPLEGHYAKMISACSADYVEDLFRQPSHPLLESQPRKLLVQHHFGLLRRLVLGAISQDNSMKDAAAHRILDYIPPLLQHAPSIPIMEPRFSASMSLAVTILERIAVDEEDLFPERIFMPVLLTPLIRRLQAHKVAPSRVKEILRLAAKYLQGHGNAKVQLSLAKRSLICYVAKYWSSAPSPFEGCLVDFIGLHQGGMQRRLVCYQDLFHQVAEAQRYNLLRIICQHSTEIRTDIESDDGLKSVPFESWPIFIFQMLQRDHSLSLLKRLIRLKPEANFLELRLDRTILSQAPSPSSRFGDPRLLLTLLQPEKQGAEHESQDHVLETLKSKASQSREQTDRAFFAKSVAFHAIASGSLKLYGQTVQWTRRFLRDAMTVKTVYSPDATRTPEGISLLGGIPEDLGSWSAAGIRTRISEANIILLNLLDTAVTSLREPSFHAPDWHGPLSLFREVVMTRMSNEGRLETHFKLSEDEVYDLLWSQTMDILLQAEEIGLQHDALDFNSPHGPLGFAWWSNTPMSKPAIPSFYRFLDNLARSRDALWRTYRPTIETAVAALKPPFPRGLPIQCLTGPVNVAVESAFAKMPFISDRAAEVVIADPAVALVDVPKDKETRYAIGQFIDCFDIALAIYVMQSPSGLERDSKMHAAWSHAITVLSRAPSATTLHAVRSKSMGTLSENEAELFWRYIFKRALPEVKVPDAGTKVIEEYPMIPTDIDPREPFEWNPAAMVPPHVESREIPATILDCMIAAPRCLQRATRHDFHVPNPRTQAIVSTPIWSAGRLKDIRKFPMPVQEGIVAAALLVESSKIEGSKTLALPFPSEFDVRYPSLFLDHDFLVSSDALFPSAVFALSRFLKIVPSTLLHNLTASAIDVLSKTPSASTKLASVERTTYELLMLLSKSDRPRLASDLIIRVVIGRPDASSWHRQLLTKSFIRSLSAGNAQVIVSLFASSILETLEHQMTSLSTQQKPEGSNTSSDRYVKVTTVKFLAQILDDADFVPPAFCVEVLSKLFCTATHLDIRVAVLDSILSRLARCSDVHSNELAERLMSALRMAIPVMGSLNERRPMQDADWTEAEKCGKLPEVYDDGGMQELPPMLSAILRETEYHGASLETHRTGIIQRIVLPMIEKSKSESARWAKMFTLKHLPAGKSINTPAVPVRPAALVYLIQSCSDKIPRYILDLYQQFFLTNVSPPPELIKLNSKVNSDIELRNSNEGQYWLSLYGQGAELSASVVTSMLTKPWKPSTVSDGFQTSHIQGMVLEQAEALLQTTDESFRHWDKFLAALEPPVAPYRSDQHRQAWLENARPVILRIIERIDALRTPEWQRDRNRQPAVLPPTFRLRLWTLDYPQLHRSPSASATFTQQIIDVLRETINLGLSHHDRLVEIESTLSRCQPDYGACVACRLGNVELEDSTRSQEWVLRVRLADGLLRKATLARGRDREARQGVKAMLDAWRDCEVEDIRMRGVGLGKYLKM